MKARITDYMLTAMLMSLFCFQQCGYGEMGHANTPPENPGSQTRTGVDSSVHPGNIDRDTIRPHE